MWLRLFAWKSGWLYDFDVLHPDHVPSCDLSALLEEFLEQTPVFADQSPYWDGDMGRCDCRRKDEFVMRGPPCKRPHGSIAFPTFTMVTALVDLGNSHRDICAYLRMLHVHLLRNVNLVVFVERWAAQFVMAIRRQHGLEHKTKMHVLTRDSPMSFYPLLDTMQDIADRNHIWHLLTGWQAGVPEKSLARYGWINHQKIDFVNQAVKENTFQTDYFVWIDAGAGHGEILLPYQLCACNLAVPGTVTLFYDSQANDVMDLFDSTQHFRLRDLNFDSYVNKHWLWHNFNEVVGTVWGGDAAGLQFFFNSYNDIVQKLLEARRIDDDQALLALIVAQQLPFIRLEPFNYTGVRCTVGPVKFLHE